MNKQTGYVTKGDNINAILYQYKSPPDLNAISVYMGYYPSDIYGNGVISGLVRVKGELKPESTVILYSEYYGFEVARVETDIAAKFTFTGLNKQQEFWIRVIPPDPTWEHQVISRIYPK